MKPSQVVKTTASHVLLYGEPKSGKSTLVSKLILEGFRLHYLSLDNGHEIIYKLPVSPSFLDEHINLIVVPDTKEFSVAVGTVSKVLTGAETFICSAHGQAGCSTCKMNSIPQDEWTRVCLNEFGPKDILVIDHGGQLSNSVMNRIISKNKDAKDPEMYKPSFTDYMNQGTILDSMMCNIQQSRANIIMITHTVEGELEDGSKRLLPQMGTANFSRNVAKYFGHVVYLEVKNRAHKVGSSTVYHNTAITGSRTDVAVENMKEPSIGPFFRGEIAVSSQSEHGNSVAKTMLTPPPITVEHSVVKSEQKVIEKPAPENTQSVVSNGLTPMQEKLRLLNKGKV